MSYNALNFYNTSSEDKNNTKIVYQVNFQSHSDFSQTEKEPNEDLVNSINKICDYKKLNSENSSNSSLENTRIINTIINPIQELNSIKLEKNYSDNVNFNHRNNNYSKDDYLDKVLNQDNNKTNKENNLKKINNNNDANTNYSTNFEEKENTMEIEEKKPNENSFKKRFDEGKKIMPKMNSKNTNLKFKKKKKKNLNKNRKGKEDEEEDKDEKDNN